MAVMTQYTLFIDGRRIEAASGRRYESVDPFRVRPGPPRPTATRRTSTPRWRPPGGR